MPLYEFQCGECDKAFEELLRSSAAITEVKCPKCGSPRVRRKVSTFASKSSGGSSLAFGGSASAPASCSTGGT
jgi:putative FmdB family regulatory protein